MTINKYYITYIIITLFLKLCVVERSLGSSFYPLFDPPGEGWKETNVGSAVALWLKYL